LTVKRKRKRVRKNTVERIADFGCRVVNPIVMQHSHEVLYVSAKETCANRSEHPGAEINITLDEVTLYCASL
jgi:hypothetical protein